MLTPGTYRARVVEWGMTEAQNGAPQLCLTFDISGHPGEVSPPLFCSFTDAALELSTRWLRACGWTGDDPSRATLDRKRVVLVTIAEETFEGKKRLRIVNVGQPPTERFAMPEQKAREIGRSIAERIALLEGRGITREQEAAAAAATPPIDPDDDGRA